MVKVCKEEIDIKLKPAADLSKIIYSEEEVGKLFDTLVL
jgi:hypothetical protein